MRLLISASILALGAAAFGQSTNADGFITWTQNGSVFDYDIHLHNSGNTNIGTLWYSWVPGQDFMADSPSATSGPSGWNGGLIVHGGQGDGYSVQWIATTPLTPGTTLDGFHFSSIDTPAMLAGNSQFFQNTPVGTTVVYEGGPFTGGHADIVLNPVPEPASLAVLALGLVTLTRRRRPR